MSVSNRSMRVRESTASRIFDVCNYVFLGLLGLVTIGPFLYLVAGSLTEASYYRSVGVAFLPTRWTLDAYRLLLSGASRIYGGLRVSIFLSGVGTAVSLSTTAALAYGASRREVPGRGVIVFLIFFTMLFGGGMVPFYLVVAALGMINSLWSLIIPWAVNVWYMIIMMKFFESLPRDLIDAARMDGCGEMSIFLRIVLPLSRPVLATMGLFFAVDYWNEWFWPTIFLTDDQIYPLQLVLRGILSQMLQVTNPRASVDAAKMQLTAPPPVEVLRMASIVVTVLPITLVYPFLQKHFVKGIMIGSIKG
jgi:putative aldouronate transport system permease protein